MTPTGPMITNATESRFLFGTFRAADLVSCHDRPIVLDGGFIFEGAVVFGTGFAYDPVSGLPVSGVVDRIEVQTRNADSVLVVHSTLSDIDETVHDLNATYLGNKTPWFDASDMIPKQAVAQNSATALMDLAAADIKLSTGDILTKRELVSIERAQDPDPKIKTTTVDLDGLEDMVVMLNITHKDIPSATELLEFNL